MSWSLADMPSLGEHFSCNACSLPYSMQKRKPSPDTDSDTNCGSSLTSSSADYVSSEVNYSPDDIIYD